jgi:hypothetical protein
MHRKMRLAGREVSGIAGHAGGDVDHVAGGVVIRMGLAFFGLADGLINVGKAIQVVVGVIGGRRRRVIGRPGSYLVVVHARAHPFLFSFMS